ncbi:hypothetical protein G5S52_13230 [Grimontia sp. S25]|uniref:Uncharacterized protein n=1 Tax=Grimontia sedimenti TaxID=2711294 RepID=A0A6M1RE13_9GAMM|nr:hypothetical protein [Grimontia sedimenti]NGN98576.1 hypothetical protein [Grimontia sedimenti]
MLDGTLDVAANHNKLTTEVAPKIESEQNPEGVKISLRETVKVESLKGQFKSLTPTERKEFLSWAIMQ